MLQRFRVSRCCCGTVPTPSPCCSNLQQGTVRLRYRIKLLPGLFFDATRQALLDDYVANGISITNFTPCVFDSGTFPSASATFGATSIAAQIGGGSLAAINLFLGGLTAPYDGNGPWTLNYNGLPPIISIDVTPPIGTPAATLESFGALNPLC